MGLSLSYMLVVFVAPAQAHTSNQAFVPLLPTDLYTAAGVSAVILTVILLAIPALAKLISAAPSVALFPAFQMRITTYTSLFAFAAMVYLIIIGLYGSHDPLVNPLPLYAWTIFWIGLVTLNGILGNFWYCLNPWTGPFRVFCHATHFTAPFGLPVWLGFSYAIATLIAFAIFMLASLSPEDPEQLAFIVSLYWIVNFVGVVLFGEKAWLERAECFSVLMLFFSKLSFFGEKHGMLRLGVPGWKLRQTENLHFFAGLFIISVFAISSFDGLNETFWWLSFLDINPLEFPGRSAIFWQTVGGIVSSIIILTGIFSLCVYVGLFLVRSTELFAEVFTALATTIVPIAVGYHIAHFLPTFLVNIQYTLAATSDPWTQGADYLGLGTFYVTTGFFNTLDGTRSIFLTQVFAVVLGHLFSIIAAHGVAIKVMKNDKEAVFSQIFLATFMIAYTFFGLWLLAAPRGA